MVKSLVSKLSTASSLSLSGGGSSSSGGGVQETNYAKHRNDPGRFFGDGVQFKAKLIGILEVGEARGDRMCQEALQDLKMAIRAAGEHKQRITIHVTIEGLRLRDEKTGDSLYHHPVHKISFIAQDMTDSRAFGYIFGSPDSGHRFFGIKTDKAASQVVLAMRDLFQVVFELKKKEIELARQQIQTKSLQHDHQNQLASLSSLKSIVLSTPNNDISNAATNAASVNILGNLAGSSNAATASSSSSGMARLGVNLDGKNATSKELSPESVADLVDLEQELSSIQRGITQMERITPNEPSVPGGQGPQKTGSEDDPFGDSFTKFPTYNILPPPPETGRTRNKPTKTLENTTGATGTISALLSPTPATGNSPATLPPDDEESWLHELDQQHDVFDTTKATSIGVMGMTAALSGGGGIPIAPLAPSETTSTPTQQLGESSSGLNADTDLSGLTAGGSTSDQQLPATATSSDQVKSDAFTDLDPLGTGRTRPYVDKKYFFQELKNPPKKVLKDLTTNSGGGGADASNAATNYSTASAVVDEFLSKEGLFDDTMAMVAGAGAASLPSVQNTTNSNAAATTAVGTLTDPALSNTTNITNTNKICSSSADDPVLLPRDTDPFSPTRKKSDPDPFQDGDLFSKLDAFEFEFGTTKNEQSATKSSTAATTASLANETNGGAGTGTGASVFNGPLQVQLPPESSGVSPPPPALHWKADISRLERQVSDLSSVRSRPTPSAAANAQPASVFKQQTVDVISSISNKKMPHLFGQARFSKRDSNSSVNMRRLQESDSLSETETAPEPPPRPDSAPYSEPPPLPPKKQFNEIVIRPHTQSAPPPVTSGSRYEYLNNTTTASMRTSAGLRSTMDVPPIPLPSRRVGRSETYFPGPSRPRKPGHGDDDYMLPIAVGSSGSGSVASATGGGGDVPPLLPPPTQMSTRTRMQRQQSQTKGQEIYENKAEIIQAQAAAAAAEAALVPDITLSQLLTLGIDELAVKLNVPTNKLSTMTLVELTAYLSEYLNAEKTKPAVSMQTAAKQKSVSPNMAEQPKPTAAIFRVNFDPQTSFVAKFDDTFGEDMLPSQQSSQDTFVANFANFDEAPVVAPTTQNQVPAVPPADRYAVFREIIDQELQQQKEESNLMGDLTPPSVPEDADEAIENVNVQLTREDYMMSPTSEVQTHQQTSPMPAPPKIDTKITEVVAQAKDRYAALRDIILVENLFDKQPAAATTMTTAPKERDLIQDFPDFSDEFNEDQDLKQIMEERASSTGPDRRGLVDSRGLPAEPSSSALTVDDDDDEEDAGGESSLDSNDKDAEVTSAQDQYEKLTASSQQLDSDKIETPRQEFDKPHVTVKVDNKQDGKFLTVTAVSGLTGSKDDLEIDDLMQRAISNLSLDSRERISPANSTSTGMRSHATPNALLSTQQQHFNDVSTSPIPQQKSPQPQLKSPHTHKSPQVSPVPSQLSAVSQLIDTATKQIAQDRNTPTASTKCGKESWATFDSPKTATYADTVPGVDKRKMKMNKATTLQLPPPPPSNTSQHDTAESPCSSDPRDDAGWGGKQLGGSSTGRRWPKKERQQTSSSSRDLSPWDDDTPEYAKQRRLPPGIPPQMAHPDRHGYYMRHARRMNSCDEDYDYDEEFNHRREQRKFKHGLSRSRDNFDLDSPSWYHHPAHHTWSPQELEQTVRGRSFERSAYERSTYGPPIYDKRGNPMPPSVASSYERRAAGYDKRGKYYRDYARPNYDFDEYGESPPTMPPYRGDSTGKMSRRTEYENAYDDGRSPLGYKTRPEYVDMYDRDRKSFDRESVESFESATRRRRSFGSGGDVYGSLDSREEYRERYLGGSSADLKTRSLRKPGKLRATGDIDYEHDSDHEFQGRSSVRNVEARSLQRPCQLSDVVVGGTAQSRLRKSSGSSPWDGEEPNLPGQKAWKRPTSVTETERRLAESRRAAVLTQTPSDGEKDRRFRKKSRTRSNKDLPASATSVVVTGPTRYLASSGSRIRDNYDYITCQDDEDIDDDYIEDEYEEEPPTDEDKFERLNRRRHEMHQRMLESERRQQHGGGGAQISSLSKIPPPPLTTHKDGKRYVLNNTREYGYADSYEQSPTPRSNASSTVAMMSSSGGGGGGVGVVGEGNGNGSAKFNFDDGFESDFNQSSPPPAPAGTASSCNSTPAATCSGGSGVNSAAALSSTKSIFRFSNDFSDREKLQAQQQQQLQQQQHQQQFDLDTVPAAATATSSVATPPITHKLRFDDNVKVSQFDDAAFEDDFAKASFDFDKDDAAQQWQQQPPPLPPHQTEQRSNNGATTSSSSTTATTVISATLPTAAVSKKQNLRNSKFQQRQELIKKSESVNIFAKKSDDPFEDDEFFKSPCDVIAECANDAGHSGNKTATAAGNNFQWDDDNNFAKFDENM